MYEILSNYSLLNLLSPIGSKPEILLSSLRPQRDVTLIVAQDGDEYFYSLDRNISYFLLR